MDRAPIPGAQSCIPSPYKNLAVVCSMWQRDMGICEIYKYIFQRHLVQLGQWIMMFLAADFESVYFRVPTCDTFTLSSSHWCVLSLLITARPHSGQYTICRPVFSERSNSWSLELHWWYVLPFRVQRRFKVILLVLLTGATVFAFWFSVSVYGYITDNAVNKFLSLCLQYFFAMAATPIYYEAAVEATYPVPEGMLSIQYCFCSELRSSCACFSLGELWSWLCWSSIVV